MTAPEIEKLVLGAILLEGIDDRVKFLKADHFAFKGHPSIFQAIKYLEAQNQSADLATVAKELSRTNKLEMAGGAYYLATLTERVASSANIETHARILVQEYLKRQTLAVSQSIQRSLEEKKDPFEIINWTQKRFDNLLQDNIERPVKDMQTIHHETVKHLETVIEQVKQGKLTGIPTGFHRLDKITGGWQNSDLIILAARPSMGKTALMVTLAMNAAKAGFPVAVFSLEMSERQITNRMLSSEFCIDLNRIINGNVYPDEMDMVKSNPLKLPMWFDTTSGLHIQEFKNKAGIAVRKHGCKMIVVDYLQLMRGDKKHREQEITEISGTLKGVAKDLDIPVIALSQLSRSVEHDGDKIPKLSHLRESGSIEQDADIVSFLWRPEYYGIDQDASGNSTEGLAKLFIAKNRNGSLALNDYAVILEFEGKYTKFKDYQNEFAKKEPIEVGEDQPF